MLIMKNINEVARIKKILYCVKKKLVHCAVLNCTKSSSKKIDNTFSFFKLLKDSRRRKKLIAKLKRANLLKDKNLHVCRKHFEENCFQRDLKVSSIFLITCLSPKYVLGHISLTLHFTLILRCSGYFWNHLFVFIIWFSLG